MRAKCIDVLRGEHRQILCALDVLDAMCTRIENDEKVARADISRLLEFLRDFGDFSHHTKEESILFPALLHAGILSYDGTVRAMLFEHNQGRSLIEALDDAARRRDRKDFVLYGRHLVELMRAHIRKEDDVLFPVAHSLLSRDDDRRVTAWLEKADKETGAERLREFAGIVRSLEREYVRPQAATGNRA